MPLILRSTKGSPLTFNELDGNFTYLSESIATGGGGGTPATASYALTAEVANSATSASYASTADSVTSASYATQAENAISASYAPAANPFPFVGTAEFSGSILVSGSIVPNVDGVSTTSSFSLGSPTAAWKDIYVSDGTINFLDSTGTVVQSIGTGNNQLTGDTFITGRLNQGLNNIASGSNSMAQGEETKAFGVDSHAEGLGTSTHGGLSHAEGLYSFTGLPAWKTNGTFNGEIQLPSAFGNLAGYFSPGTVLYLNDYGFATVDSASFSTITKIKLTDTSPSLSSGAVSIYDPNSLGTIYPYQYVSLNVPLQLGQAAHAEGGYWYANAAIGGASHAEGDNTVTLGYVSHAEGNNTVTVGYASHTEGDNSRTGLTAWETLSTSNSIVSLPSKFGNLTSYFPSGSQVILNGYLYTVSTSNFTTTTNITLSTPFLFVSAGAPLSLYNPNTYMWGTYLPYQYTTQGGAYAHAEGTQTLANGYASHAEGQGTIAYETFQHVSGKWNNTTNSDQLFIIGKGTSATARSNAFRVDSSGNVYGSGATYNTGADYAEYFESVTGEALPFGTVVELEGKKIKECENPDNAIGVISSNPTMVGNTEDGTADEWVGKYKKDIWGRYIMEDYTYEIADSIVEGKVTYKTVTDKRPKLNPNFDPNTLYTPRAERPEWNVVGLMGQIKVLKNQQIPSRWIKMEDINDDIALYLVR